MGQVCLNQPMKNAFAMSLIFVVLTTNVKKRFLYLLHRGVAKDAKINYLYICL